jgi:F-type H+-transporting ATPase subunit epsilon
MDNTFQLDIVSLTKPAFSGKVDSVTIPGSEGEMTVLKNHLPLITPLVSGEVVIRQGKEITHMAISRGFLIVEKDKATVMADSAERLEELDEVKIRAAKVYAEKLLTEKKFKDDREFADATATLEKSVAHLHMLKKHRSRHKGSLPSSDSM